MALERCIAASSNERVRISIRRAILLVQQGQELNISLRTKSCFPKAGDFNDSNRRRNRTTELMLGKVIHFLQKRGGVHGDCSHESHGTCRHRCSRRDCGDDCDFPVYQCSARSQKWATKSSLHPHYISSLKRSSPNDDSTSSDSSSREHHSSEDQQKFHSKNCAAMSPF